MNYRTYSFSFYLCMLFGISFFFFRFLFPPVNILSWDVFGYYLYLPAKFIYNDVGLHDISWVKTIIEKYQTTGTLYQLNTLPLGGFVIKYSMGLAILNSPAFFVAHMLAGSLGYPADGFSLPYQYAFAISGLVYATIGVFMLRRILLHFFDEKVTSIVLIITVAGTNYYQLTAFEGFLTHNYLFTLYSFILWFTIRWHEQPKAKYAFLLGLSMGMAILTRPSELVCILIPLLWNVSFKTKWQSAGRNWQHLIFLSIAILLAGFPQMLYWKLTTGQWLYYSYNNAGEGFDFARPYLSQVLFGFRKGWFVYTPVMAFAMAGFYYLYKQGRALFPAILIYFLFNLYVVASWTCWWYAGGSYSQRALLSSYVVLALPLGYHIRELLKMRRVILFPAFGIIILLILLNLFQTWQWMHGILDRERMTRAYYIAIFAKTSVSETDRKLLLFQRPGEDEEILKDEQNYHQRKLALLDFENPTGIESRIYKDKAFSGKYSLQLDSVNIYSPGFEISFDELTKKDYAWIRVSIEVYPFADVISNPASLVASFEHNGEAYKYKAEGIQKDKFNVKTGQWNKISFDYITPQIRSVKDKLKVYFWLQGKQPILIDNLNVDVWEEK